MRSLKIDTFIDPMSNYINTSEKIRKYFNFTYKAQKYKPRLLLELIGRVLKEGTNWISIDTFYGHDSAYPKWQTVYAFCIKLIVGTYSQMLQIIVNYFLK